LRQARLKLLIAYSTVAQIGYLFFVFPLVAGAHPWAGAAWVGGALQAVSHAFAKAAMFLAAGLIAKTLGHDRIAEFRGLGRIAPLPVLAFALGSLSLMGLPPSGGFTAKWLLLTAAIESGHWAWALIMVVGGLLAAGYVYLVLAPALQIADAHAVATPARSGTLLALSLAIIALLLGVAPPELADFLKIAMPGPSGGGAD
jgi:multicomponent Na+:H+ antiporter subunit D